jgi:fatty acid CoA ligase FadD9
MTWAEWLISPPVVERAQALLRREPALASAMSTTADAAMIRAATSSIRHVAAACERYGDRPCFVTQGRTTSYRELWRRVQAIAHLVARGDFIGICGPPSVEWIVVDLACLYSGAVSVPLHVGMTADQLRHAIVQTKLAKIFCADRAPLEPFGTSLVGFDALDEGAVVPPTEPALDELVTLNFSSGSTGMPKGVMLTERRWRAQLQFALEWPRVPHVHVGYLPHSHISGRRLVYEVMMNGGVTYFPAQGDIATLFDEIRRARPTILPVLPHLASLIHQRFLRGSAIAEMRETVLGDRLCLIRTGTAPIAPEVCDFLSRCFDVPVANGYGSTELGSIAVNGRVLPHNEYKLVDAPELGYRVDDTPPRGELYVRSPEAAIGYWNDPDATAQMFDPDGYVRTGDLVEQSATGYIIPLGRRAEVVRLAHGEFINVSELESLYGGRIPLIEKIFIYGSPHRSALLAVIVPRGDVDRRHVRAAFDRVAREAGRPRHEIPRDFVISHEPFLLTDALKLDRITMTARYRDQLEALYTAMDARALATTSGSLEQRVRTALSAALGIDEQELADAWSELGFAGFGGDSLTAVRFGELVEEALGVAPQVAVVLDPTATCRTICEHVAELVGAGPASYARIHGTSATVQAGDLHLERFGKLPRARHPAVTGPPRNVVLTGATGFLGRFLLLELLERGCRVTCLAREADDAAAFARVQACLPDRLDPARVVVYASDLVKPKLGLSSAVYHRLAAETDAVFHAGALVNHVLAYPHLFGPNVEGTLAIIRFALEREHMAVHFVSSIGIVDHGAREDQSAAELWPERSIGSGPDDYAVGYATSKWASELLLDQIHALRGTPVTIFRTGVLLPHTQRPDQINQRDAVNRLLTGIAATRLAPTSFYEGSGTPYFGGVPVDLAARWIATLGLRHARGLERYHVDEAVGTGVSLDTLLDALAAELDLERLPYDAWYEQFRAALARLPEPARSRSPHQIVQRWARPIDSTARRHFDNARFLAARGPGTEDAPLSNAFITAWIRRILVQT